VVRRSQADRSGLRKRRRRRANLAPSPRAVPRAPPGAVPPEAVRWRTHPHGKGARESPAIRLASSPVVAASRASRLAVAGRFGRRCAAPAGCATFYTIPRSTASLSPNGGSTHTAINAGKTCAAFRLRALTSLPFVWSADSRTRCSGDQLHSAHALQATGLIILTGRRGRGWQRQRWTRA
jgi:hypothetical protein